MLTITEQSWEKCKHGFPADCGDEMTYALKEHGLHELYNCGREEIMNLGAYPLEEILELKGGKHLIKVACLQRIMIGGVLSEEDAKRLKAKVDRSLAGCRHCKFYEPKEPLIKEL